MFEKWLNRFSRKTDEGIHFAGQFWTYEQLCQGFLATGGIGSGKTKSTESLIRGFIAANCPILATCVKPDECHRWERICKEMGATARLRRVCIGSGLSMDLMGTLTAGEGSASEAASFLMHLSEMGGGNKGAEAFWTNFQEGGIRYAIRLCQLSKLTGHKATLRDVYRVIMSSPGSAAAAGTPKPQDREPGVVYEFDFADPRPKKGFFADMMTDLRQENDPAKKDEFDRIFDFFMVELASNEKVRGSVLAGINGVLGRLVDPPWCDLLDKDTLTPEKIESERLIAVIDVPVMCHFEPARLLNTLWIMCTQRYLMHRDATKIDRPFFICKDEAAWTLCPDWDNSAQNVLRSQKCASLSIVQELDTLESAMGGTQKSHHQAMAFAAGHMNHLYFRNASSATNEWASKLIGDRREIFVSSNGHKNNDSSGIDAVLGSDACYSWNENYQPWVRPGEFASLPIGTAILHSAGKHRRVNFKES